MPLYEYECGACGHRFEKIQKFSDPLVHECPSCGTGPVQKLLSAPAIQFKGTGWYITDYAGKKPDSNSSSSNSESKTPAASETKSESKTETKTDSSSDTKSSSSSSDSGGKTST
jgi:putative FmdB family regulatory protein